MLRHYYLRKTYHVILISLCFLLCARLFVIPFEYQLASLLFLGATAVFLGIDKALQLAVVVISIIAGVKTFGLPLVFDVFNLLLFAFIGYVLRRNKNILGVCLLLIFESMIIHGAYIPYDEMLALTPSITIDNPFYLPFMSTITWKVMCYVIVVAVLYLSWYDSLSKFVSGVVCIVIAVEFYWYFGGDN